MSGTSLESSSSNDGSSGKGICAGPSETNSVFSSRSGRVCFSSSTPGNGMYAGPSETKSRSRLQRLLFLVEVLVPIQTIEIRYQYFVQKRFQLPSTA